MELRPYRAEDARTTRAVFERAVWVTAAADYTPEQVRAWAPPELDASGLAAWARARAGARTIVAVEDADEVVGFGDLIGPEPTVLDMLYVDPRAARRGVGAALIARVVALARDDGAETLQTHASLTARPVFERAGFVVCERRVPVVRGVAMVNFAMSLDLRRDAAAVDGAG